MASQVINGFITVDTMETQGVVLSTKCGQLRTKKQNRRFEIYNNANKGISYSVFINGKFDQGSILDSGKSAEIVFDNNPTDVRVYFGIPFDDPEYSYTSAWGVNYAANPHVIGLFYSVNSVFV